MVAEIGGWSGRAHMPRETDGERKDGRAGRDPHRPPGPFLEGDRFFSLVFLGYSGIFLDNQINGVCFFQVSIQCFVEGTNPMCVCVF